MNNKKILVFATILLIVFSVLYILLFIIRLILSLYFRMKIKSYEKILEKDNLTKKNSENKDSKDKSKEAYVNVSKIKKEDDIEYEEPNYSKKEIIGIVKPSGRWSTVIMGEKITYLMQHADKLKEQKDLSYHKTRMFMRDINKGKGKNLQ